MPQNVFKIYDGRTNFWQWDTKQKLVVLDELVTEVHFSNRDMSHSITKQVYEQDGLRLCNVPDLLLQLPRNLVAYAYGDGSTRKSVKFSVIQRPIPDGYVMDQTEEFDEINHRLEMLETVLKDIENNGTTGSLPKFECVADAEAWAKANGKSAIIVVVRIDGRWIAHMVEDDHSVTPICDGNGEMVEVHLMDGGDSDGYTKEEMITVQIWDGGSAAGLY